MVGDGVHGILYGHIRKGDTARMTRRLTLLDLRFFTGDDAAALAPENATSELYQSLIAHGMWGTALITMAVATRLPGPGSRLLHHELDYVGDVGLGDMVSVELEVLEKQDGRRVLLSCCCLGPDGAPVVTGKALVECPEHDVSAPEDVVAALEASGRRRQLRRLLNQARGIPALRTAVVHPVDALSLGGAIAAAGHGLIIPVLVGPERRIRDVAEAEEIDLDRIELVPTEHSHAAAATAVALAREGRVGALMKGALHTDEFMSAVVGRDSGLRTGRRMSHAWVMDVPTYPRPLIITDSALNIRPDLLTKADIVRNAIDLAHALDVQRPRVAILSATEEVNPQIQSTLDAAALCKMAERGQIRGGDLDGPLGFDNAISEAAAKTKGINSPVAGKPDVLLAPDLESANMLGKQLHYLADAEAAGIVLGARVPVVLTSRADDLFSRVASSAIALLLDRHHKAAHRDVTHTEVGN
ncbi:MAG: bifunctional enoyl-CoA hydratase/phosphate acetyltransferase [Aquisalimonadaceae bacterium]